MSELTGKYIFAIEGANAQKVYDAVVGSYEHNAYPDDLKLEWRDDVLFIEDEWWGYSPFGDFILPFLIGEEYYALCYYSDSGKWETNDKEGKYFTIPSEI